MQAYNCTPFDERVDVKVQVNASFKQEHTIGHTDTVVFYHKAVLAARLRATSAVTVTVTAGLTGGSYSIGSGSVFKIGCFS